MVLKKPNILFVDLPTLPLADVLDAVEGRPARRQPVAMPLGILYLSAALKEAKVVDTVSMAPYAMAVAEDARGGDLSAFIVKVAEDAAGAAPDILAFALTFSSSWAFFDRCVDVLTHRWPRATVIVGGVHASNVVPHLISDPRVDYVFRGEAEISIVDFCRQWSAGADIHVQGVYGGGDALREDMLELSVLPENLDALPLPDWDLIAMERYVSAVGRQREIAGVRRHASLMTTRGCPFQCTFCASHTVHGRRMRARSARGHSAGDARIA